MFSFKINKKTSSTSAPVVPKGAVQALSKKAFNDDDDKDEDEPDFIDGLDGNKIVSKKEQKKPEKQVLVIPLITKNEWRIDKKAVEDKNNEGSVAEGGENSQNADQAGEAAVPSIQDQAVRELLEEANLKGSSDKKSSKTIPILFENKVPDGYEEDDNMDVSLRPDQSTLDDYERIPVEEFGLAVLRGMGWKETEGIGLRNKKVVDMAEPKLRPKGMGLGAEAAHLNKNVDPKTANSNNEEKEDLSFKIGGCAVITKGSKKGYYGQIESFDEDNNRVIMRLGISGKMEAISKFNINVVSAKEYKKNAKVINSEKYEEYKAKHDKKDRDRKRHEENFDMSHYPEEPEEPRRRKANKSDSSSDDDAEYRSRSKPRKSNRDDYDYEQKSDKRSGHKERNGDRHHHKTSEKGSDRRDDYDRDRPTSSRHDSRRYDDRDRNRNDDHHRNSSRNGEKRSDRDRDHHRSRKNDDRDRRHRD